MTDIVERLNAARSSLQPAHEAAFKARWPHEDIQRALNESRHVREALNLVNIEMGLLKEAAKEIDRLHSIVALGVEMRAAQARYFKDRSKENLIASKQAETAFDKAARDGAA